LLTSSSWNKSPAQGILHMHHNNAPKTPVIKTQNSKFSRVNLPICFILRRRANRSKSKHSKFDSVRISENRWILTEFHSILHKWIFEVATLNFWLAMILEQYSLKFGGFPLLVIFTVSDLEWNGSRILKLGKTHLNIPLLIYREHER